MDFAADEASDDGTARERGTAGAFASLTDEEFLAVFIAAGQEYQRWKAEGHLLRRELERRRAMRRPGGRGGERGAD